MKKTITIIIFTLLAISVYSQQQMSIPNDWDVNPPSDTITQIFAFQISDPKDTERAAINEAESVAIISLAQKIYTLVDSRHIGIIIKDSGSEIQEYAFEKNDISTRIFLRNVNKRIKVKKDGNKFIAYCLAYINRAEAERALIQAENELTALNVYHYFMNNLPGRFKPFNITENPEGGYHSWLISSGIGIISIHGDNQVFLLNQLETFIRILFPDVIIFIAQYTGEPAMFIYAPGRLERLAGILRQHGIHFLWEHPRLIVNASPILGDLIKMNSSVIYVAGIEKVHRNFHTLTVNSQSMFAGELTHRIQDASKRRTVLLSLPPELSVGEGEILEYIIKTNPSCRYLILYYLETFAEPEMIAFQIPSHLFASYQLFVYDLVFGEIIFSKNEKNGIPINNEHDLTNSFGLLIRRLLNPSVMESISNAIEVKNELK
jgi:hypothetical protein